ncbi:MAG TPA: CcmD family protein [Polyangiaceae bacterium]|nr:CcmD family protein [Polyangiaceae bacterium]
MTQASPAPATVESRSQEFRPVPGGSTDSSSAGALLVTAYVLMWAILMAFLFMTFRRQAAVDKRLAELERALPKRSDS